MAKQVRCKTCRASFTPAQGTNRLNCYACRPPRGSAGGGPATVVPPAQVEPRPPGEIESATRAELVRAGRAATVHGAIAVRLARVMDDPDLSEARLTALAAQLERTLDRATAGAPTAADALDDRQEEIERKMRAVS